MTVDKLIDKIIHICEEKYVSTGYITMVHCSEKNLEYIIKNDRINILDDYSDKLFSDYKCEIVNKNKKYLIYFKSNIKVYDLDISSIRLDIHNKGDLIYSEKIGELTTVDIDDIIDNIIYIFNTTEIPKHTWIHLICNDTLIDSIAKNDRVKIIYKDTELAGVELPFPMIKIQINDRNINFMSNKNLVNVDKNAIYLLFGGNSEFKIKVGENIKNNYE